MSGFSLKKIIDEFNINIEDILVIYDDINLKLGKIKFSYKKKKFTHNGMKNILEILNLEKIKILRIGIGKPENNESLVNYVLENFSFKEEKILEKLYKNNQNI